jgi:hypothetical protein
MWIRRSRSLVLVLFALASACKGDADQSKTPSAVESLPPNHQSPDSEWKCIADDVKLGRYEHTITRSACRDKSTDECEEQCREEDPAGCVEAAYALELQDKTRKRASELYATACLLGNHNACTNYGAHLSHGEDSSSEQSSRTSASSRD